jgi:hypothetical protein
MAATLTVVGFSSRERLDPLLTTRRPDNNM